MVNLVNAAQYLLGIFFTVSGYLHHDGYALALGGILWIEASIFSLRQGL